MAPQILFLLFFTICVFADYNISVNATDPSLIWGPSVSNNWSPFTEPNICGAATTFNETTRRGDSVALNFVGTAIYLNVVADNYTLDTPLLMEIDNSSEGISITRQPNDSCGYFTPYARSGLKFQPHSIKVTVNTDLSYFYFISFIYTVQGSPDLATPTPLLTPSPTPIPTSPDATFSTNSSALTTLMIVAIVIGCLAIIAVSLGAAYIVYRRRMSHNDTLPTSPTLPPVLEIGLNPPLGSLPTSTQPEGVLHIPSPVLVQRPASYPSQNQNDDRISRLSSGLYSESVAPDEVYYNFWAETNDATNIPRAL